MASDKLLNNLIFKNDLYCDKNVELKGKLNSKKFYLFYTILIFFSAPLRYYLPSSIILELSVILGLIYIFKNKYRYPSFKLRLYLLIISYIIILFIVDVLIGKTPMTFLNENYRFFFFYVFFLICLLLPIDYKYILKICLYCCIFNFFFTIYELFSINLLSGGDFSKVLIVGNAMSSHEPDSQYLLQQRELWIPFIRPFGLLLQPQKSAFIPVFGILLTYLFSHQLKNPKLLYAVFIINLIITGGKTAIITGFLVLYIILFNVNLKLKLARWKALFYFGISVLIFGLLLTTDFSVNHIVFSDVYNDIVSLLNYPIKNILFGIGIPNETDLINHGYICESFLGRILAQVGIINAFILIIISVIMFNVGNSKINLLITSLFLGLTIHYCCINSYFLTFILSIYICYYKSVKQKKNEYTFS